MEIEIYSDVVCPGCYLGTTRLEEALASHPAEVILRWRPFQLDPGAQLTNSFDAHRLLWFADQPVAVAFGATADTPANLAAALHRAHLIDGLDISSTDVLVRLASERELDPDRVHRLLTTTEGTADVRAQLAHAADLGITSVPTFIFAGKHVVTGAQDTATLRALLAEITSPEGILATPYLPTQRHDADTNDCATTPKGNAGTMP